MKRWLNHRLRLVGWGLLLAAVTGVVGCASGDDNISSRPWNTPKMWENGLPSSIYEGR
jgi:hypothetical protein